MTPKQEIQKLIDVNNEEIAKLNELKDQLAVWIDQGLTLRHNVDKLCSTVCKRQERIIRVLSQMADDDGESWKYGPEPDDES